MIDLLSKALFGFHLGVSPIFCPDIYRGCTVPPTYTGGCAPYIYRGYTPIYTGLYPVIYSGCAPTYTGIYRVCALPYTAAYSKQLSVEIVT